MTPEAAVHLRKSEQCLQRAKTILDAGVPEVAAREAYLAAFHAAQAMISARTGREAKTHGGVRTQFARLTRDTALDAELRQFLPKSYDMKSVADYGVDTDPGITSQQASAAIDTATRFVKTVAELLR